ncbi:MAG: polyketide synthase [bacterium]|nr:polyketide synthase [bacterium]
MRHTQPLAIIGIGCRFPGGASSPDTFWELLCSGADAIRDVPHERWNLRRFFDANPDRSGKMYAGQGGFLQERIDLFDPLFFGISLREAAVPDPQQRVLLEVTYEAFEGAGLAIEHYAGTETGVFVGAFCVDSQLMQSMSSSTHWMPRLW